MTLSAAGRRKKGAEFEREIVRTLRDAGWSSAKRTSDGTAQVARGDIANGPGGIHMECKRHESLNVPKAFRQIEQDANPTDIPILIHRPSHCTVMATLPLDELLPLLALRENA